MVCSDSSMVDCVSVLSMYVLRSYLCIVHNMMWYRSSTIMVNTLLRYWKSIPLKLHFTHNFEFYFNPLKEKWSWKRIYRLFSSIFCIHMNYNETLRIYLLFYFKITSFLSYKITVTRSPNQTPKPDHKTINVN
jgi:hypothetical protein